MNVSNFWGMCWWDYSKIGYLSGQTHQQFFFEKKNEITWKLCHS